MSKGLNKRQKAYCYHRARKNTIEESMTKAGYTCKGDTARSIGSRLETNDNIRQLIEHERVNIFDKACITEEYILEGLEKLARTAENDGVKTRALELLGKYKAMFVEKQSITADITSKEEADILSKYIPTNRLGQGHSD